MSHAKHCARGATYKGRPCQKCRGTRRYASNRGCVKCSRANASLITAARAQNRRLTEAARHAKAVAALERLGLR